MELTQATLNDLLAQLGPGDGWMYLPGDLDPQELTDLLGGRYGAPRTLVLDGFTDPTLDESRGAALLVPFEDRAVTIRAWAYGDQWVGTGNARDAEGTERPVLVVARREVPELLAVAPDEDVDWMQRLIRINGWTQPARRPDVDRTEAESRLGCGGGSARTRWRGCVPAGGGAGGVAGDRAGGGVPRLGKAGYLTPAAEFAVRLADVLAAYRP